MANNNPVAPIRQPSAIVPLLTVITIEISNVPGQEGNIQITANHELTAFQFMAAFLAGQNWCMGQLQAALGRFAAGQNRMT